MACAEGRSLGGSFTRSGGSGELNESVGSEYEFPKEEKRYSPKEIREIPDKNAVWGSGGGLGGHFYCNFQEMNGSKAP